MSVIIRRLTHNIIRIKPTIQDFNQTILINPKYAEAYNLRGFAYINKGEYDKAIADFNQAIRINPNLTSAHNNLEKLKKLMNGNQKAEPQHKHKKMQVKIELKELEIQ
ncbi:MAG: hypothetical protein BWK80_11355 [Desulfobacteraceae bacterium IS3]|jgi:tetratricopeptide (TPR) repeat protein|nr:MAG: hypothetical protein BWK80_11355 [Desulfobacteraceae bacterium IS3]HAO23357.1 hypothetical protein [Desulfobacteraceae bacterium]